MSYIYLNIELIEKEEIVLLVLITYSLSIISDTLL